MKKKRAYLTTSFGEWLVYDEVTNELIASAPIGRGEGGKKAVLHSARTYGYIVNER